MRSAQLYPIVLQQKRMSQHKDIVRSVGRAPTDSCFFTLSDQNRPVRNVAQVKILKAESDMYLAIVDDSLLMKIGPMSHQPDASWTLAESGRSWGIWFKR